MYIRVNVTPSAKKERVTKVTETELEVSVKEPAQRNMANKRVRELVAKWFEVPLAEVRLVSGHHSRTKVFDITYSHTNSPY